MKTGMKRGLLRILALSFSLLLAAGIGAKVLTSSTLASSADAGSSTVPAGGNYFEPDYGSVTEMKQVQTALRDEIAGEGAVLLKNEDNVLPLEKGLKISCFGKNMYYKMWTNISFARAGFKVNPDLQKFYQNEDLTGKGYPGGFGQGGVGSGRPTGEVDIDLFEDTNNSIQEYNDLAVVAFHRAAGEGYDQPRTMGQIDGDYKKFGPEENMEPVEGARAVDDHHLQLDAYEAKLLDYCAEHFKKIIVIISATNTMELGFLDDPDHYAYHEEIKGAVWMPAGSVEFGNVLVKVLTGEINPSGHLSDTFARDWKSDPTWNNFGNNFMENYTDESGNTINAKGNQYANLPVSGGNGGGGYYSNYVYYKEGIYSGYRYWETRGYTEGNAPWTGEPTDTLAHFAHGPNEAIHYYSKRSDDAAKQVALDSKTWDNWYKAHVVYPFGYGLSYTDFTRELVGGAGGTLNPNGKVSVQVKVTNSGSVAGKDVVQVYYSAPYTEGGIEKPIVKLGGFAKTKLLEPGESQTLTVSFDAQDMASYDWSDANNNGFKGYELEEGTYTIYVGENAHCWADSNTLSVTYTLDGGVNVETDKTTGNKVENRFDEVSEQLLHEDRYPEDPNNDQKDMYMTRANFSDTWPTLSYRLTAEQSIIDGLKKYNSISDTPFGSVIPEDQPTDPWYNDEMPTMGAKYDKPVKLNQLFGLEYDDPLWDTFLDQLTYEQMRDIVTLGNYKSGIDIPELGVTQEINQDGPAWINVSAATRSLGSLPGGVLLAATWNEELCYRRGRFLANVALTGAGNVEDRLTGWYAPAVNVHRNPFCGRHGEYLSEDGVLTGKLSAQIILGAQAKGMFTYTKHFAVNSQEGNRVGVLTWVNEQTMREVYFKSFELCVKEGKSMGMMSSMNRIGSRWTGGSYELLTGILRNEWGFRGSVVTDSYSSACNIDAMIRAGGSLALGNASSQFRNSPLKETATTVNCLRNSTHDILYTHANSFALNNGPAFPPAKITSFGTKSLKPGMINMEYSDSLADCVELATDYYPDLDWSDVTFELAQGSNLPAGLTLSSDGTLSGVPTEKVQKLSFTVTVTYNNEVKEQTFTINIAGEGGMIVYGSEKTALSTNINSACVFDVGTAYIFDPYATEEDKANFPEITYKLANGSRLPSGLTLWENGTIMGVPDKECKDYAFTVVASAMGYSETEFTYTVSVLYPLTYQYVPLQETSYGQSYVASVNNVECDAPVTFALKEGSVLPQGLQLTDSGYITGTPQAAGIYTFTIVASSPYAQSAEMEYTLKVNLAFEIGTAIPDGKVGAAYMGSVATAQGSFDITYEVVGGALPAGLTLSDDGVITGTPKAPGTYTILVRAQDGELSTEILLNLFIDSAETSSGSSGSNTVVTIAATAAGTAAAIGLVGFVITRIRRKRK